MKRTYTLVIMDGWGIGKDDVSNPIFGANLENIRFIEKNFPAGALQASGIAVGMPWDEEGNSEIGHLTLGAGKVFYQHYPRISLAIEDGTFFSKKGLLDAFEHAKSNGSAVHLVGLVGEGIVHSATAHLFALIDAAKRNGCENLFLHLFTDGRDSAPTASLKTIEKINEHIAAQKIGSIASVCGRSYAMDRDKHWERTEEAYRILTNPGASDAIEEGLKKAHAAGTSDEFIRPFAVRGNERPIRDNDTVIFFNFREDRIRQLLRAFVDTSFSEFKTEALKNLFVLTMTRYDDTLPVQAVLFEKELVENPLGKVLSDNGKTQLRIAETEKYAHVTYFFNGLKENPFPNEYRVLIPSKNIMHHEERPEMMASAITDRAILAMNEGAFDFILINYANPDIVAHSGKYDATVKAVEAVDKEIGRLLRTALEGNHVLVITSDHGNAECVINLLTGEIETKHDSNPVPFYVVAKEFAKKKEGNSRIPTIGILSDVAPTILALMKIPKPREMNGENLLEQMIYL